MAILIFILLAFALPVAAAEREVTPSVELGARWDDNLFTDAEDGLRDRAAVFSPGLRLRCRTERLEARCDARAEMLRYDEYDDLDATDSEVDVFLRGRPSERGEISTRVRYARDESPDRDLDETGLAMSADERNRVRGEVRGVHARGESDRVILTVQGEGQDYAAPDETDWWSHGERLVYVRELGGADVSLNVSAAYTRYAYDGTSTVEGVDNAGLTAGVEWGADEICSFSLNGGVRQSRLKPDPRLFWVDTATSRGWTGGGRMTCRGETWRAQLGLSLDVAPAPGRDGVVERTALTCELDREFTADVTGSLSVRWFGNEAGKDDLAGEEIDERTVRLRPALRWELNDELTLEGSWTWTRTSDHVDHTTSRRNQAAVILSWAWPYGNF